MAKGCVSDAKSVCKNAVGVHLICIKYRIPLGHYHSLNLLWIHLKSSIEHGSINEVSTLDSSVNPRCTFVFSPCCQKTLPRRSFCGRTA